MYTDTTCQKLAGRDCTWDNVRTNKNSRVTARRAMKSSKIRIAFYHDKLISVKRYVSWHLVDCCTILREFVLWKLCNRCLTLNVTLKVTQGHRTCHILTLLVICSSNVFILHRFRDSTTFTVYVNTCDLETSYNFNKTLEITGHVLSGSGVS